MNAIELLKADHKKVAGYFEQFKAHEDGDNTALFEKINAELGVHAHIEESVLYPKLKADGDDELQKIVLEGVEEHRQIKMFLREIAALKDNSEKFNPKLKVLVEDTEHHIEEEEGEMFPLVEKQFDAALLDRLGAELEAERSRFRRSSAASG